MRSPSSERRKRRIVGAADGSIMATIMIDHIAKTSATSIGPQETICGMTAMVAPTSMCAIPHPMYARYAHAIAQISVSAPSTIIRSPSVVVIIRDQDQQKVRPPANALTLRARA